MATPSLWVDEQLVEDTVGARKARSGSISSVSTDPLDYRKTAKGNDDFDSDVDSLTSNDEYVRRPFHAIEKTDIPQPSAASEPLTTVAQVPPTEDASTIPIDFVSEAPVAQVESIILSSRTIVADMLKDTMVLDAGSQLCLANGLVVGVIASLIGPVDACSYAVICQDSILKSKADIRVAVGSSLHYDVRKQTIIFDPMTQCAQGKGTDASFVFDEELPDQARPDFSDDEEERQWKKRRRADPATAGNVSDVSLSDTDEVQPTTVGTHQKRSRHHNRKHRRGEKGV